MDEHLELLLNGQQYKRLQEFLYKPIVNKYELSVLDLRVIMFLCKHKECDTAKDIVEKHYLTKSYVSKAVDTLIEKGFLIRRQDFNDRRYIHLELLDKSLPVVEDVKKVQNEIFKILFSGVTKEEIDTVYNVAAKISSNMAPIINRTERKDKNNAGRKN